MSNSAKSIFIFGIYMLLLGATLIVIPNTLLTLYGVPTTSEVWVRVVGMLLFLVSFYYILAARIELTVFFQWTVYTRASVIFFYIAFVALGFMPPVLLLGAVIDLAGAVWTQFALTHETKHPISRAI